MKEPEFLYKKGVPVSQVKANKEGIKKVMNASPTNKASLVEYEKRNKEKQRIKDLIQLGIGTGLVLFTFIMGINYVNKINESNLKGMQDYDNFHSNLTRIVVTSDEEIKEKAYTDLVAKISKVNDERVQEDYKNVGFLKDQIDSLKQNEDSESLNLINEYWAGILSVAYKYGVHIPYDVKVK